MQNENKKVCKLTKTAEYAKRLDTTTIYTIAKTITYPEVEDWCNHYIIKDENGNEEEVREVDVVFVPDFSLPEECMISKYLRDNDAYCDEVYNEGLIIIVSGDGDWKHYHLWLRNLMEYLGYKEIGERVTEEDGSDWYGSDHYFVKISW